MCSNLVSLTSPDSIVTVMLSRPTKLCGPIYGVTLSLIIKSKVLYPLGRTTLRTSIWIGSITGDSPLIFP